MNHRELEKMYKFERFYWWHVGRRFIIEELIKRTFGRFVDKKRFYILDAGCGTGINLEMLQKFGCVTGVDKSRKALIFCRKRGFKKLALAKLEDLPFDNNFFDLLTSFDVLEHIKEDYRALTEFYRVIKPNGRILVIVPAFQFLWSSHDEALNHERRYSFKELKNKIRNSGFKLEKISYAIFFIFIPVVIYRFGERLLKKANKDTLLRSSYIMLPGWLNSILVFLLYIESKLLKRINFPFGLSIVCIAKKEPKKRK